MQVFLQLQKSTQTSFHLFHPQAISIMTFFLSSEIPTKLHNYGVFQGFSKAKFANGGSILSSRQFSILPQLAQKNEACFKSCQNRLKNNHLAT
jgi:hypothetical protein